MQNSGKANTYFYISLVSAIWFLLTSWLWVYLANLVISFPFGLIALYCWNQGRKIDVNQARVKAVFFILIAGAGLSALSLISYLIFN